MATFKKTEAMAIRAKYDHLVGTKCITLDSADEEYFLLLFEECYPYADSLVKLDKWRYRDFELRARQNDFHPSKPQAQIGFYDKDKCEFESFGINKCFGKHTKKQDFVIAMRTEIIPDILKVKTDALRHKEHCELCNCLLESGNIHVDHKEPHFVELFDNFIDFLKQAGDDLSAIAFKPGLISGQKYFTDRTLANVWIEYHKENAKLRALCSECNLKRERKKSQNDNNIA